MADDKKMKSKPRSSGNEEMADEYLKSPRDWFAICKLNRTNPQLPVPGGHAFPLINSQP